MAEVVCRTARMSYAELDDRCHRLGDVIGVYLGTRHGDRIAVLADNSLPFLELYLAIPIHGRVIVPLNTRWSDSELRYALQDSGAKVLFTDRTVGGSAVFGTTIEYIVRLDGNGPAHNDYDDLIASARPKAPETMLSSNLAGLFYTGGTTGHAKGVMLTHGNLIANAEAMYQIAPLADDDVFLVMAPMFHAAGTTSVLYSTAVQATQVFVPFDPADVLDAIEREHVTHTLAVPTMLHALVEEQGAHPRDVSSLRVLMHGAAPITATLVDRVRQTFPHAVLVHLYGTTETSPIISAQYGTVAGGSVGYPVGCSVRIIDDEVCVQGANVMAGYWNKPDLTDDVLDNDGWYHTGDLGRIDDHGLWLLDRKHDLIVTGGENVYPTEVEGVLCAHPGVLEAAAYSAPHDHWGECVHAAVVTRWPITEAGLIDYCRQTLATYKVPRQITFVDHLPRSGAGKVLRRELQDR